MSYVLFRVTIVSSQKLYNSFTSSVQYTFIYIACTKSKFQELLKECGKSVNDELLPNPLEKCIYFKKYRIIVSLQIWEGGLNILKAEGRFKEYELSVINSTFSPLIPISLESRKIASTNHT